MIGNVFAQMHEPVGPVEIRVMYEQVDPDTQEANTASRIH